MKAATIDRLYREHHEAVLTKLRRPFPDHADDALADAWAILVRKPDGYPIGQTIRGWLYVVARRRAIELLHGMTSNYDDGNELAELPARDDVLALVISRDRVHELLDFITTEDTRPIDYTGTAGKAQRATEARRRAVLARVLGVTYKELVEMTDTSYTSVNRATREGVELARSSTRYA